MSVFAKIFYRNYGFVYHDLRYIANPAIRKEVADQLLKEGRITQEEYDKAFD